MKYTPMMRAAYQEAFGKSKDETSKKQAIDNYMRKNALDLSPDYDLLRSLSGELKGIKAWANLKAMRN